MVFDRYFVNITDAAFGKSANISLLFSQKPSTHPYKRIQKPVSCKELQMGKERGLSKEVFMMRRILLAVLLMGLALDSVAAVNVLVLSGNTNQLEFPVLEKFADVDGEKVEYTQTKDRSLPGLAEMDILWVGQGEISEGAYLLNAETEGKIRSFVESGGIVISIGQDSDDNNPCGIGWITAPIIGVEKSGTEAFEITDAPEVGDLFKKPNEVDRAFFNDAWTDPDDQYIVLATINNRQDVGFALLKHGSGWYIVTSLENEEAGDVATNTPIMENLIHYAVYLKSTIAVEYLGKLPMSWGRAKSMY
jgi:hypothetical protein